MLAPCRLMHCPIYRLDLNSPLGFFDIFSNYPMSLVNLSIPKGVPWMSWEEWDMVRESLWSEDIGRKRFALEIIELWSLRGKVPHAIVSTASIIEVCTSICHIYQL
jgi:hypothetical protein